MSRVDEALRRYFTDFDGKLDAHLSSVSASRAATDERLGMSSPYICRVKARYDRDLLRLLDDGMLLAVRNFKTRQDETRYSLLEVLRFWPEHFGMRGIRDYQYYPIQFEVIEQSVADWETNDQATMMIQLSAIPINYDLVLGGGEKMSFERGFSYPIIGDRTYILNREMIKRMYNRGVLEAIGFESEETSGDARKDPRLGTVKMFEAAGEEIPIYVDFNSLVRYHFGIFAFTGGGKSNLLSNILRRLLYHNESTSIVIFDISCEYPFLLMDVFTDPEIPSEIVLETRVTSVEEFSNSIVKPKKYESDPKVLEGFSKIFERGNVSYLRSSEIPMRTYSRFLDDVQTLMQSGRVAEQPNYIEALEEVQRFTRDYMGQKQRVDEDELDQEFVENLAKVCKEIAESYRIHGMSSLRGWFDSRERMLNTLKAEEEAAQTSQEKGHTVETIRGLVEGGTRLVSLSIADPGDIKRLAIGLTDNLLLSRKRRFQVEPLVLLVWDEAQEFVSQPGSVSGIDKQCSLHVERLLRQGRKYGLGGCIATQRIAHLNTNALQQLHTYFVGTLPRPYDRGLISNTFMIDKTILERTLEFVPGEWLLSSYIATGMANVPIFIKADNAEDEVEKVLQ
ncbi:ATP-binding protein [Candidatus Bathyarchaeota archaeon]|nr:ATP-binding protein [Candidatus Bathyarchaeota archaeon]